MRRSLAFMALLVAAMGPGAAPPPVARRRAMVCPACRADVFRPGAGVEWYCGGCARVVDAVAEDR